MASTTILEGGMAYLHLKPIIYTNTQRERQRDFKLGLLNYS